MDLVAGDTTLDSGEENTETDVATVGEAAMGDAEGIVSLNPLVR